MSGALGTRPPYCTVSLPSNNTWTKFKNLSRFWRDMNYIKGNPLKKLTGCVVLGWRILCLHSDFTDNL